MLHWDPNPDLFLVPFLHWPIKWYGFFFALGFTLSFPVFGGILRRYFSLTGISDSISRFTDRLSLYLVIGTVLGARLGHFFFYEHPSDYFHNPIKLLWIREGGLASHGGAIGILLALWLFCRVMKSISWIALLDLLAPCAALVGAWIRIGNFFNQEVLGTPSTLPWAIVFGHPQDGSFPVPRHPVQLYEALFYALLFFFLWRLTYQPKILKMKGRLIGIFLVLCFGFRFFIEFFKEEQSRLLTEATSLLAMGQWLSLPFIALGVFLIIFSLKENHPILTKKGETS